MNPENITIKMSPENITQVFWAIMKHIARYRHKKNKKNTIHFGDSINGRRAKH